MRNERVKRNPILTDADCRYLIEAYRRFQKIEKKLGYDSDWVAEAIWQMGQNEGIPYFRHLLASQKAYYKKQSAGLPPVLTMEDLEKLGFEEKLDSGRDSR